MEKCQHVSKIRPAWDHSILNPEKWLCFICRTTESVWACLSCSNVACGRFNEKHALLHYQDSKHPISIEVNEKYVYCYVCDDYVLNDNAAGDIKLLRSALSAVATQKFTDIESRGRKLLRSYSHTGVVRRDNTDENDKVVTADWHRRQRLLAKVFSAWLDFTQQQKVAKLQTSPQKRSKTRTPALISSTSSTSSLVLKKKTLTPGVTGLRNLGNTCYMNSVLQVLSHVDKFRDFFLKMKYMMDVSPNGSPQVASTATKPSQPHVSSITGTKSSPSKPTHQHYTRQTTVECFQHLMDTVTPKKRPGGLNGGSNQVTPIKPQLICDVESTVDNGNTIRSLCAELHGLCRVLWSGKWAQVSPHAFLRAVWQAIPMFKGYAQHDAQEFLCELLDKIQRELDGVPKVLRRPDSDLLTNLFQGQLVSQVTCLACGNISQTFEPYMDLSLEFPNRYQITKHNPRIAQDICHITEMLAKFTEEEELEGKIYACEKCNKKRSKKSGTVYSEAKKQLLINQLPPILRLHLKRFRWSGRDHREKISTHVAADNHLDLQPFCCQPADRGSYMYHLFGVIIHHGKGFGSGHYTAFVWNKEADSWVNCNDSRMILSNLEDVLCAQAYILFYSAEDNSVIPTPSLSSESSSDTVPYSLVSEPTLELQNDEQSGKRRSGSSKSLPSSSSNQKRLSKSRKMSSNDTDLNSSATSCNSVHVIDSEISFNFKFSPSLSLSSQCSKSSLEKRGSKRSIDHGEATSRDHHYSSKSAKRLSFGTNMFYSRSPGKQGGQGQDDPISKLDSGTVAEASTKVENFHYSKLAQELISSNRSHLKRRKSTFW